MGAANFTVSVALAVLAVRDGVLQALHEQVDGRWVLPSRFAGGELDLEAEGEQLLAEHAAVTGPTAHVEQVRAFGLHDDGRGGAGVTVGYVVLAGQTPAAAAGPALWASVEHLLVDQETVPASAHHEVLTAAVERLQAMLERTTAAAALCAPTFTVPDLHQVYEAVWGRSLDTRNFHRKIKGAAGFLDATGEKATGAGRPAILYRRGPATLLHPALSRE